jgi:hypothetical protein
VVVIPTILVDVRTKGECCFNHIIGLPTKIRHAEEYQRPDFNQMLSVVWDLGNLAE